jgi:hypothetical protein
VGHLAVEKKNIRTQNFNVKTDGTYSNHWPLNVKSHSNDAAKTTGDWS